MASGTREDDQLNLTESSAAVISPSCFLGLINAKEKESCWKNVINHPAGARSTDAAVKGWPHGIYEPAVGDG